ncbi:MAG: hypothetical protein IPJ76_02400 [Flavobacteriales bacterium]|nr:MAG: hypothetical protein IPJ76_02400 [Flavobacteriales bacterium]
MTNIQAVPLSESKAFARGIVRPSGSFKWFAWLLALVLLGDFLMAVYRPYQGRQFDLSNYLPAFVAVLLYAMIPSVWPSAGQLQGRWNTGGSNARLAVHSALDALSLWRVTVLCIACAYCVGLLAQRWGAVDYDRSFHVVLMVVGDLFNMLSSLSIYWLYLLFRFPNRPVHAMGTPLWSIATIILTLGLVRIGVAVGVWPPQAVLWAYLATNVLDSVLAMLVVASLNVPYLTPKWWMAPVLYLFALSMFIPSIGLVMPGADALPALKWIYAAFQAVGLVIIQVVLYSAASRGALAIWFVQRVRFCKEVDVLGEEDLDLDWAGVKRDRPVERY